MEHLFVSQVENHFLDLADIRAKWPFDALVCDGALYAEQLVAESLHVPVFAVAEAMVMPDAQSPPPFFGLRPARTPVGRLQHAVVRKMLASGMKAGVLRYNEILVRYGVAPDQSRGLSARTHAARTPGLPQRFPGLEYPGYRPPANAEYVGPLVPARRALASGPALPDIVVDPTAKVIAVSQGTVDNADPGKLIVPTLEALKDSEFVVVATTAGVQTHALRERFPSRTSS